MVYEYAPALLTALDDTSTTLPTGLFVVRTTAVLVRGTLSGAVGVTVPETVISADPEYEGAFVATVTAGVAANATVGANTKKAARMTVARVGSVFISFTGWLESHRDVACCGYCYAGCVGYEDAYAIGARCKSEEYWIGSSGSVEELPVINVV